MLPIGQSANERLKPAVSVRVPNFVCKTGVFAPAYFFTRTPIFLRSSFFILQNVNVVNQIVGMRSAGMKFGTERTRALLDALGSPDEKLKIIHVAGTNGKGSVCTYLTQILLAAGKTVGTYMTPEVYCFEEQFLINGRTDARLTEECLARAQQAAEGMTDKPTAYERQTAAAFLMFAEAGCEYAVTECCMGGLLDTTNAVNKKVLAVITSVSLEHTAFLGDTVQKIARHKAGIIKDCPSVISQCVPEEVRPLFNSLGSVSAYDVSDITEEDGGTRFVCGGEQYFTRMLGCRQPYNAATAITAADILGIEQKFISAGISAAYLKGRLETVKIGSAEYITDGAHNPESFIPLVNLLKSRYSGKKRAIIYGCLSDKDITAALGELKDCAEQIVAVRPQNYRAMDYDKILAACRSAFGSVTQSDSVTQALDSTVADVVAVCGSFTLLKEAEEWIEKKQ